MKFTLAGKLYGLYLLQLVLPILLLFAFDYWPETYKFPRLNIFRIIFILLLLISPLFIDLFWPRRHWRYLKIKIPTFINYFILIGLIILTFYSLLDGNSGWRYSENPVSNGGTFGLYILMIAPTIGKLLALNSIFFTERKKIFSKLNILIILLLFLSVNGNMSMLYALAVTFFLFTGLNKYLFTSLNKKNSLKRSIILVLASLVLIPTAIFGYIVGESIKRGIQPNSVVEWVKSEYNGNEKWMKNLILERLSPTAISTIHIMQTEWCTTTACKEFNFLVILETGFFRLSNALGLDDEIGLKKKVNGTVSRVNYLEINKLPLNDREGTSAGSVASFYYGFGNYLSPICFLFYFFILVSLLRRIEKLVIKKLSFLGMLFLLDSLSGLFMAPLDIFLIVDDSLIFFSLLLFLVYTKKKKNCHKIIKEYYDSKNPLLGPQ